jgi:hypothetical protein
MLCMIILNSSEKKIGIFLENQCYETCIHLVTKSSIFGLNRHILCLCHFMSFYVILCQFFREFSLKNITLTLHR